jgi:hypothetical protein
MNGPDTRRDVDLERIEAALAEGAATAPDPRERELQELALALRADSPAPRPEFTHELGTRVAAGFGKPARAPRRRLQRLWVPAFAGAAVLIVVAVIAFGALGGGDSSAPMTSAVLGKSDAGAGISQPDFAAPPTSAGSLQNTASRHVEHNAQLTIATSGDDLQKAADGVGTVAESHRGFVLSSQVTTGDEGSPGGSFVLRVPSRELQSTLADLSKLGKLMGRHETAEDVTASYNSVQDKLGNALVERSTLKLRLRHATGAKKEAIRERLTEISAAVDSLSGRMRQLRSRTSYSTVSVTLEEDKGGAGGAGGSHDGGTGAAWHDAVHTLETLLNFTVRALGVLLPIGLLVGLGGFGGRALRRRRREAALS